MWITPPLCVAGIQVGCANRLDIEAQIVSGAEPRAETAGEDDRTMATESRPVDGLRVALEMERRGRGLYIRAQQFTEDPEMIALLQELAEDELRHYSQFAAMLDIFGLADLSPEENALAAAKASDFFFPGGLMQVAMDGALESSQALIEEAMQAERSSVAFYGQLMLHVRDEKLQDVIMRIIREEMTHLRTLTDRKTQLCK